MAEASNFADLGLVDAGGLQRRRFAGVFGVAEDLTDEEVEAMIATNLTVGIEPAARGRPVPARRGWRPPVAGVEHGRTSRPLWSSPSTMWPSGASRCSTQSLAWRWSRSAIATTLVELGDDPQHFYEAAARVPVSPAYRGTPADLVPTSRSGRCLVNQAKVVAAIIDAALLLHPLCRLLLGSDVFTAWRHAALAARLASVEAQKDQAAASDVDGGQSWGAGLEV